MQVNIYVEEIVPVLDYIASIIFVLLVFHPAIYEPSNHGLRFTWNKRKTSNLLQVS